MNKGFLYFSYFMIALFILFGIGVVFFPPPILMNPPWAKFVGGAILILYAVFRLERIRYTKRNQRRDKDEK